MPKALPLESGFPIAVDWVEFKQIKENDIQRGKGMRSVNYISNEKWQALQFA